MSRFNTKEIRQFGKLEFFARQVVEGFITGLHRSPFHGFSVEFAEHRAYNKGESTRHIDWKLFGKTEKLYTKRYDEETNLRCHILIDSSASMYYPKGSENNKINFSVKAAASLIHLMRMQRDAVGLGVFNEGVRLYTPAKLSGVHLNYIYHQLEQLQDETEPQGQTMAADSLHEFANRIHRRSVVFIFSDMLENNTENEERLFNALRHLRFQKHEVVLFHTLKEIDESKFEFDNRPYKFVDMESGEAVKLNPDEIRDEYVKAGSAFRNRLKSKCLQNKIEFIEADIDLGFNNILRSYLLKRKKTI